MDPKALRPDLPGATSRLIGAASRGPMARMAARTLVAGSDVAAATVATAGLREDGHRISWMPLIETVTTVEGILAARDEVFEALGALGECGGVRPDLTLDIGVFGVLADDVSPTLLLTALRDIGQRSRNTGVTVTLTVSDAALSEAVFVLGDELRQDFPEVGVVVPTRLRRVSEDIAGQAKPGNRVRVTTERLDAALGTTSARESGNAFVDSVKTLLRAGAQVGLDTDDALLLDVAVALVQRHEDADAEVVAPLGTVTARQRDAARQGVPTRVVVPYGPAWARYVSTTMAARPSLALALPNPIRRRS